MKTKYLLILLVVLFGFSCTKNFEQYNTNEKNPTEVEGEYLFSRAQKELSDQLSSTNVNWNIWKLSAQYWTETTYLNEEQFDIVNRNIPEQIFRAYYREVLKPLDEAKTLITEDAILASETEAQKTNKLMIIELLEVYAYQNLVNVFGDVPYTAAMDADNISPVYDDAADIYADLLARVNTALGNMDADSDCFVDADLIYGGNTAAWVMFGNSLKLKLAINLADVSGSGAQAAAEDAVADGVFTSGADNALFAYMGSVPNANPLHEDLVLSGRSDFVISKTLVNMMTLKNDPRVESFFAGKFSVFSATAEEADTVIFSDSNPVRFYYNDGTSELISPDSIYNLAHDDDAEAPDSIFAIAFEFDQAALAPSYFKGGTNGESASFGQHTHINDYIQTATFPGIIMTYSEIQFYIAEAAARGWSVGQTDVEAYDAAVTASFDFWGAGSAATYLAGDGAFSAYDTWQEAIGEQAYISFYTRGLVAYTEYRRLDQPTLNTVTDAVTGGQPATRFTYPVNEQTLNSTNYAAASEAIGGDDLMTKLFWDVN